MHFPWILEFPIGNSDPIEVTGFLLSKTDDHSTHLECAHGDHLDRKFGSSVWEEKQSWKCQKLDNILKVNFGP